MKVVFFMYEIYKVNVGDTIDSIASLYGTTTGVLQQINGNLDFSPGSLVIVPVSNMQPYQYYTVKKGDNMYDIARDNKIDYSLLLQLNGLDDGDYIYPNQTIMLPKKGYNVYMTNLDDTLDLVLKKMGISVDELMRENKNIYLRDEQIFL